MKLGSADIKAIETYLADEAVLCDEYLKVIAQEQISVTKLDAESVTFLGERRAAIIEAFARLRDARALLVESITGDRFTKLSDLISQGSVGADKKRLMGRVQQVKSKLAYVDQKTREFSQVLNYSLGLVNGEMSLLWSATQPISRTYNAHGGLREGVQPGPVRSGSSLGKA